MPTTATRATSPFWYIFGNNGRFAVGGEMTTYSAVNPTLLKPTYADPACINANPTTLGLDALGQPQGWPEIYWADDEKYRVVIHCDDGTEYVIDNFPYDDSGGGGGSVVGIDNDNKLLDGQFHFWFESPVIPTADEIAIAQSWYFKKNNVSATDRIEFNRFNLGQDNPEATPVYYFRYVCTGAGTGESYKDLYQRMADVRTFEQTPLTFSFDAYSDVPRTVEIIFVQNFGIGGTPSPDAVKNLASIDLPSGIWQKQSVTFTPDSVAGKSLGTDGGDHITIMVRFPLDSVCDISLTNMDLKLGDRLLPYQRLTKEQEDTYLLGAMIPDVGPNDYGKVITANRRRQYDLSFPQPIGSFVEYGGLTYADDDSWALCDGRTVSCAESSGRYKRLFGAIGHLWGRGYDAWVAAQNGNKVTILTTSLTSIGLPQNGTTSPGFTIIQYAAANPSHNFFDAIPVQTIVAKVKIRNFLTGETLPISNAGNGAFSIYTHISGNAKRNQVSEFIAKSGSAINAGQYFTIYNSMSAGATFWYQVNGAGTAPTVSGTTNYMVAVNSTDTDEEVALKTLAAMSGYQVDTIQTVAASSIPAGAYITMSTPQRQYYIWFKVGNSGNDPKLPGRAGILVNLNSGDTAAQVAQKLEVAIDSEIFRLPDRRGTIARGYDPTHAVDFDRRLGDSVGSLQYDQTMSHYHTLTKYLGADLDTTVKNTGDTCLADTGHATSPDTTHNLDLNNGAFLPAGQGGFETRPYNVAVNYLIKL